MPLYSQVRATFERFDTDRNGQLDFRELRAALAAAGLDASSAEAEQLIGRHDRDGRRVTLLTGQPQSILT